MIFEACRIYRHERSMDVDIYVLRVIDRTEAGTKLNVLFVSRPSRRLVSKEEILVKPEQYPNWKKVDL